MLYKTSIESDFNQGDGHYEEQLQKITRSSPGQILMLAFTLAEVTH
jgi:hypothetical protein